jgi:Flp pilus assembly protein TadD
MTADPVVLIQGGLALLRQGRAMAAERCAREALAAAPGSSEAQNLLGLALQAQGRHAEAARQYESLTRTRPAEPGPWVNLGTTLRAVGRLDDALAAYRRAAGLGVRSADFLYNLGLLQIDRGAFDEARAALADAHALRPDDAEIACQLAAACVETLDTTTGLDALRDWPGLRGLTTELVAKIGSVLLNLGDVDGAEAALRRAALDPAADAPALLQLVLGFERANRLDEARATYDRLLAHPARQSLGADLALAEARMAQREGRHQDAVRLYGALAADCAAPERRHFHLYPLARSLDALGRRDDAWSALLDAHASQVAWIERTLPEVAQRKRETMRVTRFGCDPADVARWDHAGAPSAAESPVFIVAFPRSGTTLLEQVLDAHPRLKSMDEQPYLQQAIATIEAAGARYPESMADLGSAQLAAARAHYWSLVRQRVTLRPGEQLIDKNPLNVLRLPAIARLFPQARIVLAIRHPCDVMLSCFMQHFRAEFAWQCRDLDTLALAFHRSFAFWYEQAAILRPAVLEVRYESLVVDFERHVRELADFLDLSWTDALLAPWDRARSRGFISSPSYAQVLQPVHSGSVGRWRAYEARFEPVLGQVRPWLERWGYAGDSEQQV